MGKFIKNNLIIVLVLLISFGVAVSFSFLAGKNVTIPFVAAPTVTPAPQVTAFSYTGKTGKDALMILKEKTKVEQAKSGLVVSINGRKADDKKHEFWAFYVNKKFASVGPAEYQTKDTDTILWKIEKY